MKINHRSEQALVRALIWIGFFAFLGMIIIPGCISDAVTGVIYEFKDDPAVRRAYQCFKDS